MGDVLPESVNCLYVVDETGHLAARDVSRAERARALKGANRDAKLTWPCRRCGGEQAAVLATADPLTWVTLRHWCHPRGGPIARYIPRLPLATAVA